LLGRAHTLGAVGRFQLEAAIQSVHCARATSGITDWDALLTLYDARVLLAPTLGARVSRAAVLARVDGAAAGLAALDALGEPVFQPWWAVRGHLLSEVGRGDDAAVAFAKAISLSTDGTVRRYLSRPPKQTSINECSATNGRESLKP